MREHQGGEEERGGEHTGGREREIMDLVEASCDFLSFLFSSYRSEVGVTLKSY